VFLNKVLHFLTVLYSLQTTEVYLYIFDAALMLTVTVVLAVFYPSWVITDGDGVYIHPNETEELHSLAGVDVHSVQGLQVPSVTSYRSTSELRH
jgi:hypothetical protein